jgi:hypothetical protein
MLLRKSVDDQGVTQRKLNILPTQTSRPGLPLHIIATRHLLLRPYRPLLFRQPSYCPVEGCKPPVISTTG